MPPHAADRPSWRRGAAIVAACALVSAVCACSPTLDWREARPEGSGAAMMFPCRPQHHDRNVALGGAMVPMRLHACSAGGGQFALATLRLDDPARVTAELASLRAQLIANLGGGAASSSPMSLPGTTPNPESARVHVRGRRPDGSAVVADAAFFVKGVTLYQATVLGNDATPGREAVDTFFGAIHLP